MDVNGQRFWMLSESHHWLRDSGLEYDRQRRCLRLASRRHLDNLPLEAVDPTEATNRVHQIPQTIDAFGTRAIWDDASELIVATGALPDFVPIYRPDSVLVPTDIAIGYDGILYVAVDGSIEMQDRRGRFPPARVRLEGFSAWRLAAHVNGGVWALDRADRRLARLRGAPCSHPFTEYRSFRPSPEHSDPPRLTWLSHATWSPGEDPIAIASSADGALAVVNWVATGNATISLLRDDGWSERFELAGAARPYSLAWVDHNRIAVLVVGVEGEALVYEIPDNSDRTEPLQPLGDFYPLRDHTGGPFLNGVSVPPHFPTARGTAPLHHLSLPSYAAHGTAFSAAPAPGQETRRLPLDGGSTQTVWHRVYLEASIPNGCGIRFHLAATDSPDEEIADADWHEHRFGQRYESLRDGVPHGVWTSAPSEAPFYQGLIPCPPVAHRTGLFGVLVQRANRPVRTLRGRYLHVRLQLEGNRRATPEIWGLRAYASRFSYRDRYLPEIYREQLFGPDANRVIAAQSRSTPSDFLDRLLNNFEGVLTPLEDRIAQSWLLTDPRSTPDDALEWLASWIGMTTDASLPVERRRRMLIDAPMLYRRRGTVEGLCRALDIATAGGVQRGDLVVVEDFKLRRTVATILGADLDPLLAGLTVSGNSYVGDTLLLGDETKGEFLALFSPDVTTEEEEETVDRFFDELAHRLTVLVHDAKRDDLPTIRRVVELETPAHVATRVITASHPLLVGMASLVGVDTYLTDEPPVLPARVETSHVGMGDRVFNPASLDPRVDGGVPLRTDAGPDRQLPLGESFVLDGSGSRGANGLGITEFNWSLADEAIDL